ncbi:aminopeptidase P family N-terminal domain-containing protein [Arthrobacter pigmenti]
MTTTGAVPIIGADDITPGADRLLPPSVATPPYINPEEPNFTREEYAARIHKVRQQMELQGLSALLVVSPENIYYLTGLNHQGYFTFTLLVLPLEGEPSLVTRAMESPTIRAQAQISSSLKGTATGVVRSWVIRMQFFLRTEVQMTTNELAMKATRDAVRRFGRQAICVIVDC